MEQGKSIINSYITKHATFEEKTTVDGNGAMVVEMNGGLRKMPRVTKTTKASMYDGGKKLGSRTTKFGRVVATKKGAKSKAGKQPKKHKGRTGSDSSQFGIKNYFAIKERIGLDEWSHGDSSQ